MVGTQGFGEVELVECVQQCSCFGKCCDRQNITTAAAYETCCMICCIHGSPHQ